MAFPLRPYHSLASLFCFFLSIFSHLCPFLSFLNSHIYLRFHCLNNSNFHNFLSFISAFLSYSYSYPCSFFCICTYIVQYASFSIIYAACFSQLFSIIQFLTLFRAFLAKFSYFLHRKQQDFNNQSYA